MAMTNSLDPYAEYEVPTINPKKKNDLDNLNATHLGLWAGCSKILTENKKKKKMAILIKGERSL
tara:strand:+ start:1450 stop:1641 length:192 start_codon:yes stop_codon:yes gene_type:complete